ncbi:transposase [Nostoc sp.]
MKVESLEVVEDHVHVLVSATPQHTIPNLVKFSLLSEKSLLLF